MDRAEIVCWVSESAQPFEIVSDHGFQSLMKTGQPGYYIPSPSTVFCNVRMVFTCPCQRITNILQVSERFNAEIDTVLTKVKGYAGKLSFATDTWTSPNHRAFITLTVHLEQKGQPLCMVLDVIELAKVLMHLELDGLDC